MQITAAVYSVNVLIVNDVFVRFMMMKLKHILTLLPVEYSTFRIYVIFLILIKCIVAAEILT